MAYPEPDYSHWRKHGIVSPIRHLRVCDVKNDLELVRKILETVEEKNDLKPRPVIIEGYEPVFNARHVERLYCAGMLDGPEPVKTLGQEAPFVLVSDLSNEGHEFLAALRQEDIWEQFKTALSPNELSALSFKTIAKLAGELALQAAKKKLGLSE